MSVPGLSRRDPSSISAGELFIPEEPELAFEGFTEDTFAILDRLKQEPHIEQYRMEKEVLGPHLKEPFKRYRDDLVLHFVLPNRIRLETERNVFSRLLKNDFGAGGCHHHYWISFYRPGLRRLTDVQLTHSLWPEGLRVGLFIPSSAKQVLRDAQLAIDREPAIFLERVNGLLSSGEWWLRYGRSRLSEPRHAPLSELPEDVLSARKLELRTLIPRGRVLALGPDLVVEALACVRSVWPVYRMMLIPPR